MHDGQEGALAEIGLALAMAFFALLVLTLLAMGLPSRSTEEAELAGKGAAEAAERRLVLLDGDRFRDQALRPVDPKALHGPLTLAIDPALPLAAVLVARRRLASRDVALTTLDATWLARIRDHDR